MGYSTLKDGIYYTVITSDDGKNRLGFLELDSGGVQLIHHEYGRGGYSWQEDEGTFIGASKDDAITLAKSILTHYRVPFCNRVSDRSQGALVGETVDETKETVDETEPHYHVVLMDKASNGEVLNFVFLPVEIKYFNSAVGLADSHLRTAYWSAKAVKPDEKFAGVAIDTYLPLAKEGMVYQARQYFPIDDGVDTYAGVVACDGKKFPEGGVWFGGVELELDLDDNWVFSGSELDSLLNSILSS